MITLAIFGSGRGSNAAAIIDQANSVSYLQVGLIITNSTTAGILDLANDNQIPSIVLSKQLLYDQTSRLINTLKEAEIDFIILAGFLWLIPSKLIQAYQNRIFNIHPALLPNYGGKGMYGMNIHRLVSKNGDGKTGITVHLVNNDYDKGKIIFQKDIQIDKHEDPNVIAKKVLILEHKYYFVTILKYIKNLIGQDI